jgi:MFS family permease
MTAPPTTAPARDPVQPAAPLRHNRRFQLLWFGALCSVLGMEAASVAYPLVILALTGSPAKAGLFGLVAMLAITAGALPAGDIVDRFDQRTVLLWSEGCRLVAVASVAVAVGVGRLSIGHVLMAAAVVGTAQTFGGTARLLVLRAVVPPGQLSAALTREEVRTGSAQLAGPPLGGFLYGIGPVLPFVTNALCLMASWVCAFLVRVPSRARPADAPAGGPRGHGAATRRVLSGVTTLWRARPLRGTVLLMVALNVATAPVPLVAIVALTHQSVPPATIGLALAGLAAGALAGTVLIRPLCRLFRPGPLLLVVGTVEVPVLWGLALPLGPYWVMSVLVASMLPIPALRVAVDILIFRRAPEETKGRTIAAVSAALGVGFAAGIGLAGLLLEILSVAGALLVLLGVLATTVAYLAGDPQLRSLPWPEPEPDPEPEPEPGRERAGAGP